MADIGSNRAQRIREQAWTDAFAKQSADAFESAFADDVVLEASTLRLPVCGKRDVQVTMQAASAYYASLVFTHEAVNGARTYVEWEAEAPTGTKFSGITVLTRNADGLIGHTAIHHRPLDAALEFSAEMERRTLGKIAPDHFYSGCQPSRRDR
jgi:SnoaL-like protein